MTSTASARALAATGLLAATLAAEPAQASDTLVLLPDIPVLVVMLVGFVLLIFPLNALIFRPIFHALDARADKISGARERSEQLRAEAASVLDRYESSIREARIESERARQEQILRARDEQKRLTDEARGEAERNLDTARGDLHRALDEARATLRTSAEDLARAAAEQILGRPLS
jgi:F-type H+-transporting ATPase subunit b